MQMRSTRSALPKIVRYLNRLGIPILVHSAQDFRVKRPDALRRSARGPLVTRCVPSGRHSASASFGRGYSVIRTGARLPKHRTADHAHDVHPGGPGGSAARWLPSQGWGASGDPAAAASCA